MNQRATTPPENRSIRIHWNGTEWQADFSTGEIVRCLRQETLRAFLRDVRARRQAELGSDAVLFRRILI